MNVSQNILGRLVAEYTKNSANEGTEPSEYFKKYQSYSRVKHQSIIASVEHLN